MKDPTNGCPHLDVLHTSVRRPPRTLYRLDCRDCGESWTRPTIRLSAEAR